MLNYDSLSTDEKLDIRGRLLECATSLGGKNYFLSMVEAMRSSYQHPLMSKESTFRFDKGVVKWQKVIFKEKVDLLILLARDEQKTNNLMPDKTEKKYKTVMNLLRAIGPMKFEAKPKNSKDGDGFIFNAIDVIDNKTCRLNSIFEIVFFVPLQIVKKILINKIKPV